jgi:hypothetical protein
MFEMNTVQNTQPEVFGLFELSDEGTVLYSRAATPRSTERLPETVGRNFFDEVAPFENTEEFRRYLNRFIRGNFPSESFNFTCQINNQNIPAKVMLVRIIERTSEERAKTTIVDIRRV